MTVIEEEKEFAKFNDKSLISEVEEDKEASQLNTSINPLIGQTTIFDISRKLDYINHLEYNEERNDFI